FLIDWVSSHGTKWKKISEIMTQKYDSVYTREQCRSRWRTFRHKVEADPRDTYSTSIKKNNDGSVETDMLIEISKAKLKDNDYILKAHGYDDSWEIVSHQYSAWNHFNKELTEPKTLYASKLRVKPKEYKLTIDDLIKRMKGPVEPVKINTTKKQSNKKALGLYFTDLHFGINTVKDYEDVLAST